MTIRSELMRLAQLKTTADELTAFRAAKRVEAELKAMTSGKRAELNRAADQEIGKTILAQMGGARRLQMMLGVTKFILLNNGVAFGWPNKTPTKGNYIEIRLNGSDLYDVVFFNAGRGAKKPVKSFDDVFAEDLVNIFERQTGWYLRMAAKQAHQSALSRLTGAARMATTQTQEIGKTILAQMGGARRLQMMLGVTKFIPLNNGVAFGWPNKTPTKGNYIEIRLNGSDLYDVVFFNAGRGVKKPVKSFDDVFADDLGDIFERQTGWYLRMYAD